MKDFDELNLPTQFKYAKDHEWVSPTAPYRIGISDFAQDQLGDLTYVELPEVGADLGQGAEFGSLESIKSVSTVYMPVGGKILAVNENLSDDPGLVNRDPYGDGWLIEIEPSDKVHFDGLMAGERYRDFVKESI